MIMMNIIAATVTNDGITLIIGAFEVDYDNGQIAFLIMKIILMAVITLLIIIVTVAGTISVLIYVISYYQG